ncbi:putative ribosomal protein L9, N-terminal domain protein [Neospora caninum Liverpool]|uniref:Putative ribosomal protein L9, N-terminal domain protein n=1 Tax=Neospora caninum (strain Liverpool) TaxID=572307 RepID=F0VL13_NEOCL|nr:putative ribosomal protein L9, N-terminal domain protein [Neospora caninum Liverpool]CBZ54765.1 putative ribosomal protein L9, N-terminal domain protein [Neospora caninum Liverpool]CEL69482.1 TPA: ribosomal protein L9, N-terminal domain protein,putative [Neospora caninum Liverpool]|eukprot:XP_003884793.1 putative ribosomal protein L9, N-terminal domain protein [Neospora caninum Liverpool]
MATSARCALPKNSACGRGAPLSFLSVPAFSAQPVSRLPAGLCHARRRPAEVPPRFPRPSEGPQRGEERRACEDGRFAAARSKTIFLASDESRPTPSCLFWRGGWRKQRRRNEGKRRWATGRESVRSEGETFYFLAPYSAYLFPRDLPTHPRSVLQGSSGQGWQSPLSPSGSFFSLPAGPSRFASLSEQRRSFAISHINPSISKGKVHYRVPNPYIPVLLLQSVPGLGKRGELKQVRRGTLRLSLAPKGIAVVATWQNIDAFYLSEKEEEERRRARAGTGEKQLGRGGDRNGSARGDGDEESDRDDGGGSRPGSPRSGEEGEEEEGLVMEGERRGEDDGQVPVASFLHKYRAKFLVDTEDTDPTKVRGSGISLYDVLSKVSEETEVDLLPSQLAIGRRQKESEVQLTWSGSSRDDRERRRAADERREDDEEEQMRQDGIITRCGVYTVYATIPLKNRTAKKSFAVEVLSKQEAERILREKQRREEEDARRSDFALGEE